MCEVVEDQGVAVEAADPAQAGDDAGVDAPGAYRRVGEVDEGVPGRVELGNGGTHGKGLCPHPPHR